MIFDDTSAPSVFGMPIGVPFAPALANGLLRHYGGRSPEELAHVEILVNSTRMKRSLTEAFQAGRPLLLPRIRLITDLIDEPLLIEAPSDLRTTLELTRLVGALLDKQISRAPRAALFDLAQSLNALLDEMQGESVDVADLDKLDVSDQSGHWQNSLEFIRILSPYLRAKRSASGRLLEVTQNRMVEWSKAPPDHPIIVAGSTGSRGATRALMTGVANLPKGALVLPGFDFDLPENLWRRLDAEDHPQYRLKALLDDLNIEKSGVFRWLDSVSPDPHRNKLISLALRPAPVTSDWIDEGPKLGNLIDASQGMILLEANSPREEAEAIALGMRKALDDGQSCALVSPDRMLTRQVAAALDRWNLVADDSAGTPLLLSAPGRLLSHLVDSMGRPISEGVFFSLLKHPLSHGAKEGRGEHLRLTREFELYLRRQGPLQLTGQLLVDWADGLNSNEAKEWATWLSDFLAQMETVEGNSLSDFLNQLVNIAERFCAGPLQLGSGGLWDEQAGREAKAQCDKLKVEADAAGEISLFDFAAIFKGVISKAVVRDRDVGHPDLLILGTLEARVHSAELVILAGLNEGVWPEMPSPDPWLNRSMRRSVGLLLPERQVGLSAHDFQQAAGAKRVWLTRSKRTADAETVPSRWLNRLTNLMLGLPKQQGPEALLQMRGQGDKWLGWARSISAPMSTIASVTRPSPCPPKNARPNELSVTRIKGLIRDPYAIYAEKILRLRPLEPLDTRAIAPLRGVLFHRILERFLRDLESSKAVLSKDRLLDIAAEELEKGCPWSPVRLQWMTQFEALASAFISDEITRRLNAEVAGLELRGIAKVPKLGFQLTGIADRIDVDNDGKARIYDYKTGVVPTAKQQEHFDKQLLLEAAMVELGAFTGLGPTEVRSADFVSIKPDMKATSAPLEKHPPQKVWNDFEKLIANWADEGRGYTARMALFSKDDVSSYDHLSRFGEWDLSDHPQKVDLS